MWDVKMKKIAIICILLTAFLSISIVSAHENATDSLDSLNANDIQPRIDDSIANQNAMDGENDIYSEIDDSPTEKIQPNVEIYATNGYYTGLSLYYGNKYTLEILTPKDSDVVPTITINGENSTITNYGSTDYNNEFYTEELKLEPGIHNITGIFAGDDKYLPETKTVQLEIKPCIRMPIELKFNETLEITLHLPNGEGNLTAFIDGNFINSTRIVNNEAAIRVNNLTLGEHEIHAVYTGNDYNVINSTNFINVIPVFIYPSSVMEHNNETIFVVMNPNIKGNVSFIYDKKITKPLIDGKANFTLSNLTNNIIESGSEVYMFYPAEFLIVYPSETNRTYTEHFYIDVTPYPPKIINNTDFIMTYGEDKTFSVSVIDEHANPPRGRTDRAYIYIDSIYQFYRSPDNNGTITFKVNEVPGEHNISITCLQTTEAYKLTVKPTNTSIDINSISTGYYNKQIEFTAHINPTEITSGELEIYVKDSLLGKAKIKNGTATFKYTPNTIGTVKFKAIYKGNDYCNSSSKEFKVTIKKATPIITSSAKTFKASAKTKSYTVTFKANGKAIANKKLTLTVKGKTYTATTNSQGKATFKITKLTKKGTHTATIKFPGNSYYNKATKTVKLKFK